MAQTAAHPVDQVLPHVPVRQWLLGLPLRLLLAAQPQLVTPVRQVVAERLHASCSIRPGFRPTRPTAVRSATVPLHHPPGAGQRARAVQRRRAGDAQAEDALARNGTTHIVMSPLEFMQRLAALVARPKGT